MYQIKTFNVIAPEGLSRFERKIMRLMKVISRMRLF